MKRLFKPNTNSQQGIIHHIIPVAVVVILFASVGGYFLLRNGHAATQPQLCGNGGSGYCMNNWSNSGKVKMEYGGSTNENFQYFVMSHACGNGMVTNTCPFTHTSFDRIEAADHAYIVQIRYMPTGQCIAGTGINAILGGCPDNNGNGGSSGSVQVLDLLRGGCKINLYML